MARLFWLADEAWIAREPRPLKGLPGRPRGDGRVVISGILPVLEIGCRWRAPIGLWPIRDGLRALSLFGTRPHLAKDVRDYGGG